MRWLGKERLSPIRGQKGISLIETVIALALLGIIAVVFLNGLTTASRVVAMNQERVAAESLAKSQLEHIKSQDYISVFRYHADTNCYEEIAIPANLTSVGYNIEISPPEYVIANGENMTAGRAGFELQSITIVIKNSGKTVFTLSSYRTGMAL